MITFKIVNSHGDIINLYVKDDGVLSVGVGVSLIDGKRSADVKLLDGSEYMLHHDDIDRVIDSLNRKD